MLKFYCTFKINLLLFFLSFSLSLSLSLSFSLTHTRSVSAFLTLAYPVSLSHSLPHPLALCLCLPHTCLPCLSLTHDLSLPVYDLLPLFFLFSYSLLSLPLSLPIFYFIDVTNSRDICGVAIIYTVKTAWKSFRSSIAVQYSEVKEFHIMLEQILRKNESSISEFLPILPDPKLFTLPSQQLDAEGMIIVINFTCLFYSSTWIILIFIITCFRCYFHFYFLNESINFYILISIILFSFFR